MHFRLLILVSLFAGTLAAAQTAVLPPPRPSAGPDLRASLQFIEDAVSHNGFISFSVTAEDTQTGEEAQVFYHNELTDVVADSDTCRISYHWRKVNKDEIKTGFSYFPLRAVKGISVSSYKHFLSQQAKRQGHSGMTVVSTLPALTIVNIQRPRAENYFLFTDSVLADRVARELNHAVELCGGGI